MEVNLGNFSAGSETGTPCIDIKHSYKIFNEISNWILNVLLSISHSSSKWVMQN